MFFPLYAILFTIMSDDLRILGRKTPAPTNLNCHKCNPAILFVLQPLHFNCVEANEDYQQLVGCGQFFTQRSLHWGSNVSAKNKDATMTIMGSLSFRYWMKICDKWKGMYFIMKLWNQNTLFFTEMVAYLVYYFTPSKLFNSNYNWK